MKQLPVAIICIFSMTVLFLITCISLISEKQTLSNSLPLNYKGLKKDKLLETGPFGSAMRLKQDEHSLSTLLLSKEICFLGSNERPDSTSQELILRLRSSGENQAVQLDDPIYIGEGTSSSSWSFSSAPTPLYLVIKEAGSQKLHVEAYIKKSSKHEKMKLEEFSIPIEKLKGESFYGVSKYDMKWYGKDLLLEDHGGFEKEGSFQKVFYSSNPKVPPLHMQAKQQYLWKDGSWNLKENNDDAKELFLLACDEILDSKIKLCLWSPYGVEKEIIELHPSTKGEASLEKIADDLRFLSIKNPSKLVIKFNSHTHQVSPGDWILMKPQGFELIDTKEVLTQYIDGELLFPLLIFDQLKKKEGTYVLNAHLYNATRSKKLNIELPLRKKSISNYAFGTPLRSTQDHSYDEIFNL